MPELPEVNALAAFLRENAAGQQVAGIDTPAFMVLKTADRPIATLIGERITTVDRHGKFLDIGVGAAHLVIHLARAGWLRWREDMPTTAAPRRGPLALRLRLNTGAGFELTEQGTQKRLAVYLVAQPQDVPGISALGPDALDPDLSASRLGELLRAHGGQLKRALTDQRLIAGIGNAYSDEILHAARFSPFAAAAKLSEPEVARLHEALRIVLTEASERAFGQQAATLKAEKRSGMRVHGRTGLPCPVCGDVIAQVSYADRSLQYCPTCQTNGKPLADRRLSRLLK